MNYTKVFPYYLSGSLFTIKSQKTIEIDALSSEILAVNEQEKHRLHVESDYAFSKMVTTQWGPDAEYLTQTDYLYQMPLLMTSHYPLGPGISLQPGETFKSFRTFEILHDSDDRDRKGLARLRMFRTVAPQITENPIYMHVRSGKTGRSPFSHRSMCRSWL